LLGYNGDPDGEIIQLLNEYIESSSITVHIDKTFPLAEVKAAHETLEKHYLGKICMRIQDGL
jgi:NADPH:quinone reductase